MAEHVCPWWLGYFLVSPIRRWMQNPDELIAPYVTPGMTVLEPGPGMGFFTLPLARRVGSGRVIAVDIQPKMLNALRRKLALVFFLSRLHSANGDVGAERARESSLESRPESVGQCWDRLTHIT